MNANTPDEFAGQGGRYEMRDGVRVRVQEPTRPAGSEAPPQAQPAAETAGTTTPRRKAAPTE